MDAMARACRRSATTCTCRRSRDRPVLQAMRRGYTYAEYLEQIDALRARIPDLALSTDSSSDSRGDRGGLRPDAALLDEVALRHVYRLHVFAAARHRRPARRRKSSLRRPSHRPGLVSCSSLQEASQRGATPTCRPRPTRSLSTVRAGSTQPHAKARTRCNRIVNFPRNPLPGGIPRCKDHPGHAHSLTGAAARRPADRLTRPREKAI